MVGLEQEKSTHLAAWVSSRSRKARNRRPAEVVAPAMGRVSSACQNLPCHNRARGSEAHTPLQRPIATPAGAQRRASRERPSP